MIFNFRKVKKNIRTTYTVLRYKESHKSQADSQQHQHLLKFSKHSAELTQQLNFCLNKSYKLQKQTKQTILLDALFQVYYIVLTALAVYTACT